MSKRRHRAPWRTPAYPLPLGFNSRGRALAYRWFSGRPLNGHRYTDATGFRYGTSSLDPSGHAARYHLLPGYKRFAYFRLPLMAAPFVTPAVLTASVGELICAGIGVSALTASKTHTVRRERAFRREIIEPLGAAVSNVLRSRNVAGMAHTWVSVSRDFRESETAEIRLRLPMDWIGDDGDKERLRKVVSARLQLEEISATWEISGESPSVRFSVPPKPPKVVEMQEALSDLRRFGTETQTDLLMGLGARRSPISFSLTEESPHLLIAGGSGAGKSELLAALVSQFLRAGYGCVVLDAKFTSHMWMRSITEISYNSETEDLHNALLWLDGELLRRARFVSSGGDPASLSPLVVVLEEMNAATNRLRSYWREIKETGAAMMSPALTALGNLSSMGRELRMHILMAGQSMTGKAVGGPENRENFGGRALARATAAQWRMLAPQIKPAPVKRNAPGRWHIVVGDTLREFQVPFMDIKGEPQRLIEFATSGEQIPNMPLMMTQHVLPQDPWSELVSSDEPTMELAPLVTLSEFVEHRPGVTLVQLNNWRARYRSEFPTFESTGHKGAHMFLEEKLDAFVTGRVKEEVGK